MTAATFLDRFRKGLARTRDILNADVEDLVRGRRPLEPEDLDAIEEALIAADLGLPATQEAMEVLRERSARDLDGRRAGHARAAARRDPQGARPAAGAPRPSPPSPGSCSWWA